MIALRHAHPALSASGEFVAVVAETGRLPFVFERTKGDERILVAVNPAAQPCATRLPASVTFSAARKLAGEAGALEQDAQGWTVRLAAVSYAIVKLD